MKNIVENLQYVYFFIGFNFLKLYNIGKKLKGELI